ncbi:hypothetical protein P879_06347 [Paragonimus westermani]|uniref:DH domain-containing protein n=1 Tax=Paragonimus westermani TaxID=34504 RepID=A0A8T0CZY3_9TREM|nr:hypothetical protein P879_06347 [Paragonimus westermani]
MLFAKRNPIVAFYSDIVKPYVETRLIILSFLLNTCYCLVDFGRARFSFALLPNWDQKISPSSPDEKVVSPNQADVSEPGDDDVLAELTGNMFMNPETSLHDLIRNSEYLQKYPSWLGFCGTENKKKYAPTFIARNDTIWELIFSERGYMDMLLMVRDVYMIPFPDFDPSQFDTGPDGGMTNAQLREALFPGLDQLIRAHERLLRPLLALHDKADDHVVKSLGSCLVKLFDRDTQLALSKLYGGFMFAQKRIRERLQICKRWPPVAQFFEKCKQDPRSARRSLEDCHMVIVQRWTKVETLLDAIIKNTLNHPVEVENLETARSTVRSLLKGAEAVMTAREHMDKLSDFADNLLVPVSSTEDTEEHRLRKEMKSPNTSLINYGPLRIVPYAIGQQAPAAVEVIGVALNSCFFVLQRLPESGNYQLFKGTKMPSILWWGQAYGYFRKSVEKGSFGFFILLHSESVLTLFRCNTVDELSRWEKIMNHGFAQWRETAPVTMESLDLDLSQTLSAAAQRWDRTNAVLNLLYDLDADLERAWSARSCVCLALIEDRLNQVKAKQDAVEDNSVDSDYLSITPPGLTGNFGSRPKSAGYIHRTPKAASTPTTTADLLSKYTFLTDLDGKSDLDQVFALFQENLDRLRFAIMGAPPPGLSRSASDVEERKRPPNKAIRKTETFSVRDNTHLPNDPKALAELNRKVNSKKVSYRPLFTH